jgi:hypothetical protein
MDLGPSSKVALSSVLDNSDDTRHEPYKTIANTGSKLQPCKLSPIESKGTKFAKFTKTLFNQTNLASDFFGANFRYVVNFVLKKECSFTNYLSSEKQVAKKRFKDFKIFKMVKNCHNCLQLERVLRIFLLSYFECGQNLAKYSYGWSTLDQMTHSLEW